PPLDDVAVPCALVRIRPGPERPAALRTLARLLRLRAHHLDPRERARRPRAVAARRRRRAQGLGRLAAAAPLRRGTEERPGARGELLLQALDLQLELRVGGAVRLRQRAGQLHET